MISATCGGTISSQLSSPLSDALEHVPRKDRQIFGIIVIELHETAATDADNRRAVAGRVSPCTV